MQPFTALRLNLPASHQQKGLSVSIAPNASEIAEAQRLRYKIFAEEMGADLSGKDGLDVDGFDTFCDHLLVRDSETSQVIGTYHILSPHQAFSAGGYYSAGEFDLTRHSHFFGSAVELGRLRASKLSQWWHHCHAMGRPCQVHATASARVSDWLRQRANE